ncbi:hypothetical protein ACHAPU_007887 [Fusarium lateritium]
MGYSTSHEAARYIRTEGTGLGLLTDNKFQRWLNNDHTSNVLAGIGRPGTGKTVLTSLVVDEIKRVQQYMASSNIGLAFFYFSYKVSSPMRNVALALLEQLYLQSLSPPNEVKELEARYSQREHIPFREIVSIIATISNRFQKCYIVIDALDECASEYQQDLLYLLASIRDTRSRLFVTSRSSSQIDMFLEPYPRIQIITSKNDVELFVMSKLESSVIGNDPELLSRVVNAIIDNSEKHGMFLLVTIQVRDILQRATIRDIAKWLQDFQGHFAPEASLDTVYQKELDKISSLPSTHARLAQMTLTWLYFAQRPLEVEELTDILKNDDKLADILEGLTGINTLVEVCMGLVRLVQVEDSTTITFSHFSIKEFFDCNIGKRQRYIFTESVVAVKCLFYIDNTIGPRFYVDEDVPPGLVNKELSDHPFLQYAAKHWGHHLSHVIADDPWLKGKITDRCFAILKKRWKMALVSHVLFRDIGPGLLRGRYVKSSVLHTVAYFGLTWAVDQVWIEGVQYATDFQDSWGRTAIHIAAEQGHAECLEKLIKDTDLISRSRRTDTQGRTPWHYVAMSSNTQAIEVLASRYPLIIDQDSYDKFGFSPLQYAAEQERAEAFQSLIRAYPGGEISKRYIDEALQVALANGRISIIQIILDFITPRYEHLVIAIRHSFVSAIKLLLDYIDDLDEPEAASSTALLEAVLARNNTILSFLIRSGASLDRADDMGRTPLAHAVHLNNVEGVRLLLDAGANPAASWSENTDLVTLAASQNMIEVMNLLLKFRPSSQDLKRAIFCATEQGHAGSVQVLLQSGGVSAGGRSKNGQTLSEVAQEAGFEDVVALLEDFGVGAEDRALYNIDKTPSDDSATSDYRKDTSNTDKVDDKTHSSARAVRGVVVDEGETAMSPSTTAEEQEDTKEPLIRRDSDTEFDHRSKVVPSTNMKGEGIDSRRRETSRPMHKGTGSEQLREPVKSRDTTQTSQQSRFEPVHKAIPPRAGLGASLPVPRQDPEPEASAIIRSTKLPKAPATFFLLEGPIPVGRLRLGMVVADARDPLRQFVPKEIDALQELTHRSEYETVVYDWTMSRTASKKSNASVAAMLSFQVEPRQASRVVEVDFRAPRLHRRQLQNHDHVIKQICSKNEFELLEILNDCKEVYVIVGLLIATDLELHNREEMDSSVLHTVGAGIEIGSGIDVSVGAALGVGNSKTHTSRYSGDQVLAVQYRVLKLVKKIYWKRQKGPSLTLGTYFKGDDRDTIL